MPELSAIDVVESDTPGGNDLTPPVRIVRPEEGQK
jgi:hypothetical protein